MGKDYTQIGSLIIGNVKIDQQYLENAKAQVANSRIDTDELIFKSLKNGVSIVEWCVISDAAQFIHRRDKVEFSLSDVIRFGIYDSAVCIELSKPARIHTGCQYYNTQRKQRNPTAWQDVKPGESALSTAAATDRFIKLLFKHKPAKVRKDTLQIFDRCIGQPPIEFLNGDWCLPEDRSFSGQEPFLFNPVLDPMVMAINMNMPQLTPMMQVSEASAMTMSQLARAQLPLESSSDEEDEREHWHLPPLPIPQPHLTSTARTSGVNSTRISELQEALVGVKRPLHDLISVDMDPHGAHRDEVPEGEPVKKASYTQTHTIEPFVDCDNRNGGL